MAVAISASRVTISEINEGVIWTVGATAWMTGAGVVAMTLTVGAGADAMDGTSVDALGLENVSIPAEKKWISRIAKLLWRIFWIVVIL